MSRGRSRPRRGDTIDSVTRRSQRSDSGSPSEYSTLPNRALRESIRTLRESPKLMAQRPRAVPATRTHPRSVRATAKRIGSLSAPDRCIAGVMPRRSPALFMLFSSMEALFPTPTPTERRIRFPGRPSCYLFSRREAVRAIHFFPLDNAKDSPLSIRYDIPGLRWIGGMMESTTQQGPDVRRIERLATEMALTFNWISLYQEGHPSLAGRVEKFHRNLAEILNEEPSGHLLLGVAKNKIYYQNIFLGQGNSLVRSFTSDLFQHQVATLDFSKEVTPRDLLAFFLSLQRIRLENKGGKLDETLKAEGVRGIGLYPYNYKEVLSRRIIHPNGEAPSANREDELWRMILTIRANAATPATW